MLSGGLDGAERVIGWHTLLQVHEGQHRHLRLLPSPQTLHLRLECPYDRYPAPSAATVRIDVFQQPARGLPESIPPTAWRSVFCQKV